MRLKQKHLMRLAVCVALLFASACVPATPIVTNQAPATGTSTQTSAETPTGTPAQTTEPTNTNTSQPTRTAGATVTMTPPASLTPTPPATATLMPSAYDNREFPVSVLASYINAVNRQEYERAYQYWENPPAPSLEAFIQGFTQTMATQLIVDPRIGLEGAAGSVYASIPTVLIATHTDNSQHIFSGCYVARRSNVSAAPSPQGNPWALNQAQVTETTTSNIMALLEQACPPGPQTGQPYDDPTSPEGLLASYYDAINREDFQRAYGYWDPLPAASFEEFVSGFADTNSVRVVVRPPIFIGAAAGSQYANLPVFLVALHDDGREQRFMGCFVARRPNLPTELNWHLYDATLEEVPSATDVLTLLNQACPVA